MPLFSPPPEYELPDLKFLIRIIKVDFLYKKLHFYLQTKKSNIVFFE